MAHLALHHVQVNVVDVDPAVAFYEHLGARRRGDRPDLPVEGAWLDVGDQQLHLVKAATPAALGQHFALEVDDLDAMVVALRERGISVTDPHALGAGLPPQCVVLDPSGNQVELRGCP